MCVTRLCGAGRARKNFCEWRLALYQVLQTGLHGAQIVEGMHALGTGAQFAGSLRPAQQQDAEYGDLVTIEIECLLEPMLVLGYAAVRGADGANQGLSVEGMQSLAD